MRLSQLNARFIRYHCTDERTFLPDEASIDAAHGIIFLCPLCYQKNNGPVGTHSVICWFEGRVPDDAPPAPGRWNPVGTGIEDLSFVPGKKSNSVLLLSGCAWHGFVNNGDAT